MIKIDYIKKKNSSYILGLQDKDLKTFEEVIIKYSLFKPCEVSNEVWKQIEEESIYYANLYMTVKYLTNLHTENEVRDMLLKKECTKENIEKIVEKLKEKKLINDPLFAKSFLSFSLKRGKGPKEITFMMQKRGIDSSLALQTVKEIDDEAEKEIIQLLFKKSLPALKKVSKNKASNDFRQKMIQKGFKDSNIQVVLNEGISFLGEDEYKNISHDFQKALNHYQKKYSDYELKNRILLSLKAKGYTYNDINEIISKNFN